MAVFSLVTMVSAEGDSEFVNQAAVRSSRGGAGRAKRTSAPDGSTRSARSGAWASRQSWHRSEAPAASDGAMRSPQARHVVFLEVMPPSERRCRVESVVCGSADESVDRRLADESDLSPHSGSRATVSAGCSAPARSARRTRIRVMLMARVSRAIPAATRKPRANPVEMAWR
jgi:hypothetical protein